MPNYNACEMCGQDAEMIGVHHITMDSSYRCKYYCKKCVPPKKKTFEERKCRSCNAVIGGDVKLSMVVGKGHTSEYECSGCYRPSAGVPDVFWDGKPEINLADDPNTGEPRVFFSKGHKASYLRERGLMEAGDRVHGAPVQLHQNQNRKIDTKHEVQMSLKKIREMGRDRRRQEYNRIIKEGRRYA